MAIGYAAGNLGFQSTQARRRSTLLQLLLDFESWLDRRASRRALYEMDDRTLADIGLSRADVEGLNASSWHSYAQAPTRR
jgi:uncharacterized protein YjiS (DUF1127 family)